MENIFAKINKGLGAAGKEMIIPFNNASYLVGIYSPATS